ncbi:hypothetical protein PSEUBRA_003804 [Kalmanozyma brasiliensis GHG001]|uniref:uncharacterized protein n=1 Tax=Kalmanozyma brasiliensis (strain GHG001) TaxID=1365824 RepID=UPI001CEAF567|nr:uncharacterized protein PSEUBRA_003804 [Kalmanozyma brasiliensis GHG001]KAF6767291.1 hypothetical protein PSEUBRA_003804 [Kalmanozyma brasiliensis GHG001]
MNCEVSSSLELQVFGRNNNTFCSPFEGPYGHSTNCSDLAQACYQGYVVSPMVMTEDGNQTVYVGNFDNDTKFEECANKVVGPKGWFQQNTRSFRGCHLAFNTTDHKDQFNFNAAWPKHSIESKSIMFFTYIAIILSMLSCFVMVGATEFPQVHHGQHSQQRHHLPAQLKKVGHGSLGNITFHPEYLSELQPAARGFSDGAVAHRLDKRFDFCTSCDLNFWDEEGCKGNVYRVTVSEKPLNAIDCAYPLGFWTCSNPGLTEGQMLWVSSADPGSTAQSVVTMDQSCSPKGPSIKAEIKPRSGCTFLGAVKSDFGLRCYPGAGSPLRKRGVLTKRRGNTCHGFRTDKAYDSWSNTVQVSPIVDCSNQEKDCSVSTTKTDTTSIETSWSVTTGGEVDIPELFKFSASSTFGSSYTDTVATATTENYLVKAGYMGFIGATAPVTVFEGTFTSCDDRKEYPGRVFALKKMAPQFGIVYTN